MKSEIIALGTEVGKVLNGILEKLPTRDQRVMKNFFIFLDRYEEEIVRADSDHDDLIVWKQRKDDLMNTVIKQMREKK